MTRPHNEGSIKLFVQCFHYSISIQIIICDILYRLSLPFVIFRTFVTARQLMLREVIFYLIGFFCCLHQIFMTALCGSSLVRNT